MGPDEYLCEFGPFTVLVDPQYRFRLDLTQGEAPGHTFALFQEFHFGFQKPTVVKCPQVICFAFIIVGDYSLSGRAIGVLLQPIVRLEKQAFALRTVAPEGSEFVEPLGPNIIIQGDDRVF